MEIRFINFGIARNQTTNSKMRFKRESGLGNTNGCFVHNKQNAPPNPTY